MDDQKEIVPINVVGSSKFGIYPKIDLEKTYNLFISDGWLINYAGYKRLTSQIDGIEGRAIFNSTRGKFYIVVIDDKVYKMNTGSGAQLIGLIRTRTGEVFIAENLTSQICIVDGKNAWIYNYNNLSFTEQTLDVGFDLVPGHVSYHNSFFLITPSVNDPINTTAWYAFQRTSDTTIELVPESVFPIQTKPDNCLAVTRLPGKGNNVLVIGSTVCEVFTQVGGNQNYRRNSSFNIDSGCISISTIAANENFVCFLAQNEHNSPTLLYTDGGSIREISTDGINNRLKQIKRPDKSTAFFYKQDGHLFYHLTFFDPKDNLTLAYDFTTDNFYHITDSKYNFHPARQIIYFDKKNIFVSLKYGSVYEMSIEIDGAFDDIDTDEGNTIPRVRIPSTYRIPTSEPYIVNNFQFWLEQGVTTFSDSLNESNYPIGIMLTQTGLPILTEDGKYMLLETGYNGKVKKRPRVDMSFSKSGNLTFSTIVGINMNTQGHYKNRMRWYRLGRANEITFQLRFWGLNRFIINNATMEISK